MKLNLLKKYGPIIIIWIIALFLRTYNQTNLLGFYYDQARDALKATEIINTHRLPAIGPTTGINGLYLGPFWYYLITPGYLVAKGNPAIASYFIAFLESLTVPLLFILLKKYHSTKAGYVAAILWTFSLNLIKSSRWFSNPSPLPTFVVAIIFLIIVMINDKHTRFLPLVALLLGLSLQLESASAIFFFPSLAFIGYSQRKLFKKTSLNQLIVSAIAFGVLLLPQLAFEIKNKFLLTRNLLGFISGRINSDSGKSWGVPTLKFIGLRFFAYYQDFISKLDPNLTRWSLIFLIVFIIGLFKIKKNNALVKVSLIWLFVPLIILLFFVGNYGVLYDYYLTGFFPAFIILTSIGLVSLNYSTIISSVVLLLFAWLNLPHLYYYLSAKPNGPEHVSLGNQLQSVKYICQQVKQTPYNIDAYVPPVIPYTYEYLFAWQTSLKQCPPQAKEQVPLLYTLYEVDPPHPERLHAWLQRQQKIGTIIEEKSFGGITVQRRTRIMYEKK